MESTNAVCQWVQPVGMMAIPSGSCRLENGLYGAAETRLSSRAFTLVELFVTIAIISVLAALLLGGVGKMREAAKSVQCVSNERQIVTAMLTYAGENQGRLPLYETAQTGGLLYFDLIAPYLDVPTGLRIGVTYLRCPAADVGGYSYGVNYGPTEVKIGVFGYPPGTYSGFNGSLPLSEIPNTTMILGDSAQTLIYNPAVWGLHANDFVRLRHRGGFNCAFIDGSVRWISKEEWYVDNSILWRQLK